MRLLKILPGLILAVYVTVGNMTSFRPPVMKYFSLAMSALIVLASYIKGRKGGLSAIDKAFLIFMVLNALAFFFFPQTLGGLIALFPTALLYGVLFLAATLPALFVNRYFTEFFARQSTPEAVWETDIFKAINRHMTWLWAALFALATFVAAMPYLFGISHGPLTDLLFQVALPGALMIGVGMVLNKWYPQYYQRKMGIEPDPYVRATDQPQKEETMPRQITVVALNGSPHGAIGNTSQMTQMIASALSQEAIRVEEILLADRKIEYCIGCGVCLEKGACWRPDDFREIVDRLLAADGIILASPVYFGHVTAQMKTFIDRSLPYGHKLREPGKPGLAISVSAGRGETETGRFLARILGVYGAFSVGVFTAIATNPGAFLGKEAVEARAGDLARDLATAIKEKRSYPVTDEHLSTYLFMKELVTREKEFMQDDYKYWQETGLLDGFESFAGQKFAEANYDPEFRKEWLKEIVREYKSKRGKGGSEGQGEEGVEVPAENRATGKASAKTCLELLKMMPSGFKAHAAQGLAAVYQFEITGGEKFTAHLKIEKGRCTFHEDAHEKPDVTIESPAHIWLAISRGEMSGQTAFMAEKYRVEGNLGLVMKLKSLFG